MLKSRLYWKVLANFGLLIAIITAMTLVTVFVLRDIESDFQYAGEDARFLSDLEQVSFDLSDLPVYAETYARTGAMEARFRYEQHLREAKQRLNKMIESTSDSATVWLLHDAAKHLSMWAGETGTQQIARGDLVSDTDTLQYAYRFESQALNNADLSYARNVLRKLYRGGITEHQSNINNAAQISRNIPTYIYIVNILIVIFAIVLGLVLTRSIVKPLRNLRESTERLTDGTFEPIDVDRNDELGDLYRNFNTMSVLLYSQFKKLKIYSDFVTSLNSTSSVHGVAARSLSHLCHHTVADAGAIYLVNRQTNKLERINSLGFETNGTSAHSVRCNEGFIGKCAATNQQIDLEFTKGSDLILPGLRAEQNTYVKAIPIEFRERTFGVLVLAAPEQFSDEMNEIIYQSLPQIAVSITNARHYEETQNLSLVIAHKNKELYRKNEELEKAYRIKSDFLSSISHELRTPLNSIIGYSSALLKPGATPLDDDQRNALNKVLKGGKDLLQLINDILDLSKIEAGRVSLSVNTDSVRNVVKKSVDTIDPLFDKRDIRLKIYIQNKLPALKTDTLKIQQILINLLSNAIKFTDKGDINLRVYYRERMMYFEVRDPGIGIAEEHLERIFEEFRQIDSGNSRKYKGTGLGLPIARRLARLLGGEITVKSRPGKGSIFTFSVPPVLIPGPGSNDTNANGNGERRQTGESITPDKIINNHEGFTILCIDDDPDAIEILKNLLLPEGYSITGASSGEEGIKLARQIKPSLITLDIVLPGKDGWQVLRELKKSPETRNIPVIIHSIVDNQPLALQLGAIDVMPKPVDANKLLSLVQLSCNTPEQYVLLVDDNREFSMVMRELIEHDGFNVKTADNGIEALTMVKEEKPAIIFLDLVMPEMDGFSFINELKAHDSLHDIPVIILSGKALTGKEKDYLDAHIQHYLKKEEFSHDIILNSIKRMLTASQ